MTKQGARVWGREAWMRAPRHRRSDFGINRGGGGPALGATYYVYDPANRLQALRDALGQASYYGYDAVGNLVVEALATGGANYFRYDAAQRQTGQVWQAAGGSRQYFDYDYDAAGNLVGGRDARGWARYARDPLGRVISEVASQEVQLKGQPLFVTLPEPPPATQALLTAVGVKLKAPRQLPVSQVVTKHLLQSQRK